MEVNPIEFGELRGAVRAQGETLKRMSEQIDELMSMANRSKGALWAGMSMAGAVGGLLTWLGERLLR